MDTKALRQFGYGVYLVTALDAEGRACGCVVNTGMQLTSSPYRVMVAVNRDNATYAAIKATRRFAVTCLTEAADMGLVGTFGFHRSTEIDKFAEFETASTSGGIPYVVQAAGAVVECSLLTALDVGTHEVLVGDVTDAIVVDTDRKPMTYAYYHGVLRGTTPPKASAFIAPEPVAAAVAAAPAAQEEAVLEAGSSEGGKPSIGAHFAPRSGGAPTLIADYEEEPDYDFVFEPALKGRAVAEAPSDNGDGPDAAPVGSVGKHHFQCMLCGYVVETDLDELPVDFRCPMCGAGPEKFTKLD